jgi:hypothetical protein
MCPIYVYLKALVVDNDVSCAIFNSKKLIKIKIKKELSANRKRKKSIDTKTNLDYRGNVAQWPPLLSLTALHFNTGFMFLVFGEQSLCVSAWRGQAERRQRIPVNIKSTLAYRVGGCNWGLHLAEHG